MHPFRLLFLYKIFSPFRQKWDHRIWTCVTSLCLQNTVTCFPVGYIATCLSCPRLPVFRGSGTKAGFAMSCKVELGWVLFFDIVNNGTVNLPVMICMPLGDFCRLEASKWRVHASTIWHLLPDWPSEGFAGLQFKPQWWEYLFSYTFVNCGYQYS